MNKGNNYDKQKKNFLFKFISITIKNSQKMIKIKKHKFNKIKTKNILFEYIKDN